MKYYIVKYTSENLYNCCIVDEESKDLFLYNYKAMNRPYVLEDINKNVLIIYDITELEIRQLYNIKMIELEA